MVSSVSATYDQTLINGLELLPSLDIPLHTRHLANLLGVCTEINLKSCLTVLQILSNNQHKDVDLYVEWMVHLQLYIRQKQYNLRDIVSTCKLYMPDSDKFCSLNELFITTDVKYTEEIKMITKYLSYECISPTFNSRYWQFKTLFITLGCHYQTTIADVIAILQLMSLDKSNFYQISDCTMILTEMGRENVSILLQYLETLLLSTILKYHPELCQIVNQRNMNAPYGSKDEWNWRFQLMASHTELKALLPTQSEINRIKYHTYEMTSLDEKCFIPLLTVDQQLVASPINIVYSCSELNLIQNFVKDNSIRRFISPIITKNCPLLMASLNVDYVERRGLIAWSHAVNNLEYTLQQLTKIFQETLKDNTLQVIGASYTSICHCLSDSTVLTVDNVDYVSTVDRYYLEIDYPFWIFNNTIVLCSRFIQDIQGKATVAVSALTTLLHKRNHLLLDEAKVIT
ncbi:unnamed protein product [Didymodactylos carnosus]|uniref:Uncharacterized protein n=1 Tax=Didymodactylos carnosus TaxID=1234261 RepID=A0A8S2FH89_9BILA|nr:unnamed protein product [Didymodactylos carnosus]CAF4256414.1 unnamed protein product [Didymodactylos carnosus]